MVIKKAGIADFLAKTVAPKLLRFSKTTINPESAKLLGTGGGALLGGVAGSNIAPEGDKTKGFVVGALTGGIAGRLGAGALTNFARGGADANRLQAFAREMQTLAKQKNISGSEYLKNLGKHIADKWAVPEHLGVIPTTTLANAPKHRALLSIQHRAPVQKLTAPEGSGITRSIGNMARNVKAIAGGGYGIQGSTPIGRTIDVLKSEANEAAHYIKDGYRYKRSFPGKILGVTLGSGLGFGAIDAATATNDDGTPAKLPKRLFKGTTTALGWGLAAPALGTKALLYDIPKTIINPES